MKFLRTLPYLFISTILFCSSLYSASTDSLHIFAHMRGDKKYDDFQYGKGIGDINKDGYKDLIIGSILSLLYERSVSLLSMNSLIDKLVLKSLLFKKCPRKLMVV